MSDEEPEVVHGSMTLHIPSQAMDGLIAAAREFEQKAAAAAFESGFKAGWEQATKAFEDAFSKLGRNVKVPFDMNLKVNKVSVVEDEIDRTLLEGKSVSDQVLTLIGMRPGLRGVGIVTLLNKSGAPVLERTTRTVLWRLKNAGRIKVVDGRWYTPESAPPGPPSQEEEADDAAAN